MIARPRCLSRLMRSNRCRISDWVRLLVGSSKTRMRHPMQMPRAISTNCCSAMERLFRGRSGINVRPSKLCHGVSGSAAHFRPGRNGPLGRLHAEENVFHDGQVAGEGKFLVDHGNAASPGLERIAGAYGTPLDPHFTLHPAKCAPDRTFIRVLLPAPFSPTNASISPGSTAKSMPSGATVAPKPFPHASHTQAMDGGCVGRGRRWAHAWRRESAAGQKLLDLRRVEVVAGD